MRGSLNFRETKKNGEGEFKLEKGLKARIVFRKDLAREKLNRRKTLNFRKRIKDEGVSKAWIAAKEDLAKGGGL